jgi:hypothetical protein
VRVLNQLNSPSEIGAKINGTIFVNKATIKKSQKQPALTITA